MKRVVVIAMILAMMATLFAFPTYATTYNPTTYNSYTDAVTVNGVTYNVRVTQLKALSEGTSLLPGGMETIMLVSLQMTNNTNSVKAATIPKLTIDLSDERVITDVFTYGGDFTLGLLSGGIGIFYPGSEFSLDNNKVIVPPNKSLYFVGAIGLPAQLSQDGSSTLDTGLRAVHLYDKANYSVTDGNYSYGNPVDLSSVISYIDGIEAALNTSNNNTSTIINRLNNIITLLSYTGNLNGLIPDNISGISFSNYNFGSNLVIRASRVSSKPVVETVVSYTDPASDQTIFVENCYYDVDYYYRYRNTNSKSIKLDRYSNAYNFELFGSELTYQSDLIEFESNFLESYQIYTSSGIRYLECYPSLSSDDRYIVIPVGDNMVHYKVRYHWIRTDTSSLPALPTFDVSQIIRNISDYTVSVLNDYFPRNIYNVLRDLYISLTKPSSEDNTEEAQDMNDEIHEQEQTWYDNNSEALENVGLSNYRFSQSQSSGISQAVTQFQAVWNALGNWTNVYIFILILSISTYIIRHEPTTRVKQYRSSVQAERAERISYYGRKNAESRASASSGSTLKNAIRRRK